MKDPTESSGDRPGITFGFIAKGPGLMNRPIARSILEMSRLAEREGAAPVLDLAFVLPGRMGRQDSPFELQSGGGRLVVFIAVPDALVKSDEPAPGLVDLARSAIDFASATPKRGLQIPFDNLRGELERVAHEVLGDAYRRSLSASGVSRPTEAFASTGAKPEWSEPADSPRFDAHGWIQVVLDAPDRSSIDAASEFEGRIAAGVAADGVGEVDGNEIGEGAYVIFIHGSDVASLQASVGRNVRASWKRPGATMRLLGHDDEGDGVRLT